MRDSILSFFSDTAQKARPGFSPRRAKMSYTFLLSIPYESGMIVSFRSPMPGGITTFLSVCLPLLLGR
jgi:hypothetical protein